MDSSPIHAAAPYRNRVVVRRRGAVLALVAGMTWLAFGWAAEDTSPGKQADSTTHHALLIRLTGPIGPATRHHIAQGLKTAQENASTVVVLQIDTPGGLESAMRDIVKDILASPTPVISFVAPNGARAASAGTYIMYASHVAAMAPATHLGSATPVPMGGDWPQPAQPQAPEQKDAKDAKESTPAPPSGGSAMERKVVNDAVAYIRSLAELRGRNADWAEQAVREGANIPAAAALERNVIDLIATDVADLLEKTDGRKVKRGATELTLETAGLAVQTHEPDWRTQFLSVITHPTVAYGLLLIGLYGLLFEGYSPGAIVPGVAGAICLLLALFALQVLSVNFAGFALIVLGALLFIGEAFVPSFGALGIGGLVAFVFGSVMLFDKDVPGYSFTRPVIFAIALVGGLLMLLMVTVFARSRRRPVTTGIEQLLGSTAEAAEDFTDKGRVRLNGEVWNARTSSPVKAGEHVKITKVDGLLLWVSPTTRNPGAITHVSS